MTQAEPRAQRATIPEPDPLLTALLSHDIRSALTRVMGASQILEDTGLGKDEAGHVARIKSAALYIDDLLAQALEEPDTQPVTEVEPVLAELELVWAAEAEQQQGAFVLVRKGNLPDALHLPRLDFMRIFNNIISNGLKFSHGGLLGMRLSPDADGGLLIEVEDDGPGFSIEAQARLFSSHGRPDESPESGSGYGLYIAHSLVQKAGGEIRAENRPSGGARVTVRFPEDLLMVLPRPAPAPSRPQPGLPDLSHLKILLAEDNPTNQLVATQMLKKMNARVETAADGVEAMACFERGDYNLGLIDIEMPRKSGLEVLREMRARGDEKAGMTLLALTAYVLPEHQERITAAGADGIIAKPLTDIAAFGNAILVYTGGGGATAPSAPQPGSPDANIDLNIYNGLKKIIGKDSMLELLGKVQSDLSDVQSGLRDGVEARDTGPVRANTHILISVAGAIGAVGLQHIAERLNATAKSADWADILPQAKRCQAAIAAVLGFVAQELES